MNDSGNDSPVTYFQLGSGNCSFIDHFCISPCFCLVVLGVLIFLTMGTTCRIIYYSVW